jgi:hypothetical protein
MLRLSRKHRKEIGAYFKYSLPSRLVKVQLLMKAYGGVEV